MDKLCKVKMFCFDILLAHIKIKPPQKIKKKKKTLRNTEEH